MSNDRLDIRKCSAEGVNRLVEAILLNTVRDWNTSAKIINKNGKNDKELYELMRIIDFIQSNYFIELTNGNCPQKECIDNLLLKIHDRQSKEILLNYVSINEQKWNKENKKMQNNKTFEINVHN